jgi:hypothetical protein
MNRHRNWLSLFAVWRLQRRWYVAMAGFSFISMIYLGAYLGMMTGPTRHTVYDYESGRVTAVTVPCYAFTNHLPIRWSCTCIVLFEPANRLDRALRPRYWSVESAGFPH